MIMKTIKTNQEYQIALKKIDELIDCPENSKQEEELEIVSLLVWDYEERR